MMTDRVQWISTKEASLRLGVTLRSLYRFIDEGELAAYKFGRVIRLKEDDVARYIDACRIAPGDLEHLYPARRPDGSEADGSEMEDAAKVMAATVDGTGAVEAAPIDTGRDDEEG